MTTFPKFILLLLIPSLSLADCQSGFGVEDGMCQPCSDPNCKSCYLSLSKCHSCNSGFYLENESGVCLPCSMKGCDSCPNDECEMCKNSLAFDSEEEACVNCGDHCLICFKKQFCATCEDGFGLIDSKCIKCSDSHCRQCYHSNENGEEYCITCEFAHGLKDGKCVPCAESNCLACTDDFNYCKTCSPEFLPIGGHCIDPHNIAEDELISLIENDGNCKEYALQIINNFPYSHIPGCFDEQDGICRACDYGFIATYSSYDKYDFLNMIPRIQKCSSKCNGIILLGGDSKLFCFEEDTECPKYSTEIFPNYCMACIENCESCSIQGTCDKCLPGYHLLRIHENHDYGVGCLASEAYNLEFVSDEDAEEHYFQL